MSVHDLIGTTIAGGKYRVRGLLGEGGMGAVFEGEHVDMGKRVAVKVISAEHSGSEEIEARFKREARAASAVQSENILQVFDVGRDPVAGLYMVMELLSGQDLSARLEADKKVPVALAVVIGMQAAKGLAKAHAAGVVHRDLKPANVFLTTRDDGSLLVKVLDFGISKLTMDEPSAGRRRQLTQDGAIIGTPQYMSPEQAQGLPVDLRTDVWSLGVVLYEALSGGDAYSGNFTPQQVLFEVMKAPPRPLLEVAPWVHRRVAAVIDQALAHDPAVRLADCDTLVNELTLAAETERLDLVTATRLGATPSGGPRAAQKRRKPTAQTAVASPDLAPQAAAPAPAPSVRQPGPVVVSERARQAAAAASAALPAKVVTPVADARTAFQAQAENLAADFATFVRGVELNGTTTYTVDLAVPEGQSTGGGKHAAQHVRLLPKKAGGLVLVAGTVSPLDRITELRSYDYLVSRYRSRFEGGMVPVPRAQYDQLVVRLASFFRMRNMPVKLAELEPGAEPAAQTKRKDRRLAALGGGLGVLVVALVALCLTMFLRR